MTKPGITRPITPEEQASARLVDVANRILVCAEGIGRAKDIFKAPQATRTRLEGEMMRLCEEYADALEAVHDD